jgi:parallel beta-helix repeat protein
LESATVGHYVGDIVRLATENKLVSRWICEVVNDVTVWRRLDANVIQSGNNVTITYATDGITIDAAAAAGDGNTNSIYHATDAFSNWSTLLHNQAVVYDATLTASNGYPSFTNRYIFYSDFVVAPVNCSKPTYASIHLPGANDEVILNQVMDILPEGGIVTILDGTVELDAAFNVTDGVTIFGEGPGITGFDYNADGARVAIPVAVNGIHLQNFSINGNFQSNSSGISGAGDNNDVRIENIWIHDIGLNGSGISIDGDNTWIANVRIENTSQLGIALTGSFARVEDCYLWKTTSGIQPNNDSVIKGNTILESLGVGFGNTSGADGIHWEANTVRNCVEEGFDLINLSDSTIIGNTIDGNADNIYVTGGCSDITIDGNILKNSTADGFHSDGSISIVISNNQIIDNDYDGIDLGGTTYGLIIEGNTLKNNQQVGGSGEILINGSSDNHIRDNYISTDQIGKDGIYIFQSSAANNTLSGNIFEEDAFNRVIVDDARDSVEATIYLDQQADQPLEGSAHTTHLHSGEHIFGGSQTSIQFTSEGNINASGTITADSGIEISGDIDMATNDILNVDQIVGNTFGAAQIQFNPSAGDDVWFYPSHASVSPRWSFRTNGAVEWAYLDESTSDIGNLGYMRPISGLITGFANVSRVSTEIVSVTHRLDAQSVNGTDLSVNSATVTGSLVAHASSMIGADAISDIADYGTDEFTVGGSTNNDDPGVNIIAWNNNNTRPFVSIYGSFEKGLRLLYDNTLNENTIGPIQSRTFESATPTLKFQQMVGSDRDIDFYEWARFNAAGGTFYTPHGIRINKNSVNSEIDGQSNGSGSDATYIGNQQITTSVTQFHWYLSGDLTLQSGELVILDWVVGNPVIKRCTVEADPRVIGIYQGNTRWKDSLGNRFIESGTKEKEYIEVQTVLSPVVTRKRIVQDYENPFKIGTNQRAVPMDFARSVAVIGDSYESHDRYPLTGAWVTIDGGSVQNGDWLMASSKSGYMQKWNERSILDIIGKSRQPIIQDTKTAYIYLGR